MNPELTSCSQRACSGHPVSTSCRLGLQAGNHTHLAFMQVLGSQTPILKLAPKVFYLLSPLVSLYPMLILGFFPVSSWPPSPEGSTWSSAKDSLLSSRSSAKDSPPVITSACSVLPGAPLPTGAPAYLTPSLFYLFRSSGNFCHHQMF